MASDRRTELRLSRLENDTVALYDLVAAISATQQEHSRRFDAVDQRLDVVDQRLDAVDQRFDAVDQRFDAFDQRFDAFDQRFDVMGRQLETVQDTLAEVVRRLPAGP